MRVSSPLPVSRFACVGFASNVLRWLTVSRPDHTKKPAATAVAPPITATTTGDHPWCAVCTTGGGGGGGAVCVGARRTTLTVVPATPVAVSRAVLPSCVPSITCAPAVT